MVLNKDTPKIVVVTDNISKLNIARDSLVFGSTPNELCKSRYHRYRG